MSQYWKAKGKSITKLEFINRVSFGIAEPARRDCATIVFFVQKGRNDLSQHKKVRHQCEFKATSCCSAKD